MSSIPYFDRLSEAYAVLDGIPDLQVTLDIEQVGVAPNMQTIGVNQGRYTAPGDWSAMVLTPDIWLSLCPAYIEIVEPLIESWEDYGIEVFWRIEGRTTSRFEVAMAHLFNLSYEAAENLFGMRGDDEADGRSDKQVFLDRVLAFLRENGQNITIGTGHLTQEEMQEHGISLPEKTAADADAALPSEKERDTSSDETSPAIHSGFAVVASETDTPGAETFDTEASAATVNPVVHQESTE